MTSNIRNLFDLNGKVAIVSGGAQGLGEAIATALTHHGATTFIFDINIEAATATAERIAAETQEGRITALECDIRDDQQVQRCVKTGKHRRA